MNPHETGYICFTDQGPVVSITGNINYAPILYPLSCGDQERIKDGTSITLVLWLINYYGR